MLPVKSKYYDVMQGQVTGFKKVAYLS